MRASLVSSVRTMPDWRAAWQHSSDGFAIIMPLTGTRAVLAVGTITMNSDGMNSDGMSSDGPALRARMRATLEDRAMVDGHDPGGLFHRVNASLSASGVGRIDSLALLSRPGDAMPPSVAGFGRPLPLVVTPDRLSAPVQGTVSLARGWAIVMGPPLPGAWPQSGLLTSGDVLTALSLFTRPSTPGAPLPTRTLLSVLIDG